MDHASQPAAYETKVEGPASTYAGDGTDSAESPPRVNVPIRTRPGYVGPNYMNRAFVGTQPFLNNEHDDIPLAFAKWSVHWGREYATREEYDAGLKNFEENYLQQLCINIPTCPLWMVLNHRADRPYREHHNYTRMDWGIDSDEDDDPPYSKVFPVPEKDGTTRWVPYPPFPLGDLRTFVLAERRRIRDQLKDDTKEHATVKHQSTLLPVKRPSDDKDDTKEEDQDKRPQIGCGGQKQGCCSDGGK